MNSYFLVFEDLLRPTQKSVAGPFSAESPEALVEQFQLQKCKNSPYDWPPTYWDGKKAGEVKISIVLQQNFQIQTPGDLQEVAHRLQCDWY